MEKITRKQYFVGFFGVIVLWSSVFAWMVLPQEIRFVSDAYPRIILETAPVDPFDLMRGDYVILSYPSLQPDEAFLKDIHIGDNVFAILNKQPDNRVTVENFTQTKPVGGMFIRGKVQKDRWGNDKTVKYGLESYYVPQGKGRELEKLRNRSILDVEAAVSPQTGRSTIIGLMVNDKPVDDLDQLDTITSESAGLRRFQFHSTERYAAPINDWYQIADYDYFKPFFASDETNEITPIDTKTGLNFEVFFPQWMMRITQDSQAIEEISSLREFFQDFLAAQDFAEGHISDISPENMRFEYESDQIKIVLALDLVEFVEVENESETSLVFNEIPVEPLRFSGNIFLKVKVPSIGNQNGTE